MKNKSLIPLIFLSLLLGRFSLLSSSLQLQPSSSPSTNTHILKTPTIPAAVHSHLQTMGLQTPTSIAVCILSTKKKKKMKKKEKQVNHKKYIPNEEEAKKRKRSRLLYSTRVALKSRHREKCQTCRNGTSSLALFSTPVTTFFLKNPSQPKKGEANHFDPKKMNAENGSPKKKKKRKYGTTFIIS